MIARAAVAVPLAFAGFMSLGAFLSGHAFPGELLAFFRIQYAIVFAVLALVAATIRNRALCAVALVLLAVDAAALVPALAAGSRPDPPEAELRLLVANVWYPNRDFAALDGLIRREQPDVIGLVELTQAYAAGVAALRQYRYRAVRAEAGPYGVGLYSRVPVHDLRIVAPAGSGPHAATGVVAVGGRQVRLFLVHPPPPISPGLASTHRTCLRAVGHLARAAGLGVLVCGDFNAPPWSAPFRDLLRRGRLDRADPWRPWQGTWPSLPEPFRVPIDTCAGGRDVAAAVHTGPRIGSDHRPILVRVGSP